MLTPVFLPPESRTNAADKMRRGIPLKYGDLVGDFKWFAGLSVTSHDRGTYPVILRK